MPRPPASPLPEEEQVARNFKTDSGNQLTDSHGKSHSSAGKHAKKVKKHSKPDRPTSHSGDTEEVVVAKPKRHKKSSGEKHSAEATTSSYPCPTDDASDTVVGGTKRSESNLCVEEEPVKKKKKRSKDHHQSKMEKVRSKKSSVVVVDAPAAAASSTVVPDETCAVDTTSKVKESHRSKDRKKSAKESEKLASATETSRKYQLATDSPPEYENEQCHHHLAPNARDETFRPISPDEPHHERFASPRHSSRSSRFSSAHSNSSSYSRSPSHRQPERRSDVRSYRERGRGPRARAPDRSRSPDPRHFCPRRTYVAYHPHNSHSRDSSSFEEYGHDSRQTRFRRSRSRSHGPSRPSHYDVPSHDFGPPQSASRARMPSPRRTYSQRHFREEHERNRESPRRPPKRERYMEERHTKHESFSSDARRTSRPYRSRERPHDTAFTSPEAAPITVHESRRGNSPDRSRHRESRRSTETDRRAVRKDRPRASPPKVSKRQPTRSEHHAREDEDEEEEREEREEEKNHERQRLPETRKHDRPRRRTSVSQDRQSVDRATPPDCSAANVPNSSSGTSRRKPSSASKSPRRTKSSSLQPRKSQSLSSSSTSKLRPVLDHLDQLQFENVSDTELEAMLTPASFLTNAQIAESHAREIEFHGERSSGELNQAEAVTGFLTTTTTTTTATTSNNMADTSKPTEGTEDQQDALVLDTLDKISSQLRQKLAGPETWDSGTPGSESEADELDDAISTGLDMAMRDPSVIGMATAKTGLQTTTTTRVRQLTAASLTTPWQQLIESASKAQGPSREEMPDEAIKPAVCVGTPLQAKGRQFPCRLVPLQQRASGALTLSHIGVSARYLGAELLDCLNKELTHLVQEQTVEDGQQLPTMKSVDDTHPGSRPEFQAHPVAWMHRTRDVLSCGQELPKDWIDSCLTFGVLGRKSDALMRQYLLQSTG